MTTHNRLGAAGILALAMVAQPAQAITWFDFTSLSSTTAIGNAGGVGVTVTGTLDTTYSQTSGGINYWGFSGFSGFQPTNTDMIAVSAGDMKTITFSVPVTNVYLALTSWNVLPGANLATSGTVFSQTFTTLVGGNGYWAPPPANVAPSGSGTNTLTGTYDEVNGVILFMGEISSITFVDPSENFHGFTVGYDAISPVPEAATWAMMLAGFGAMGASLRRRKTTQRVRLNFG